MTYSLNTLNASSGSRAVPRSGAARFGHEIGLVLGLVAWVFWLLALLSYSAQDAAWSTSGAGQARMVSNWVGRLGAWLADSSYFMLGFSVWWAVVAFVWAWLSALARGMESLNSINEIMASGDEEQSGTTPAPVPLRGAVRFEHVAYRYPDAECSVLTDFDLAVPAGSSVAFVGPSGAGKTTLCKAMTGIVPFYMGGRYSGDVQVLGESTKGRRVSDIAMRVGLMLDRKSVV